MTLTQVRAELNQDEERQLSLGVMPVHEISSSQFLLNGIELEEAQYVSLGSRAIRLTDRTLQTRAPGPCRLEEERQVNCPNGVN